MIVLGYDCIILVYYMRVLGY